MQFSGMFRIFVILCYIAITTRLMVLTNRQKRVSVVIAVCILAACFFGLTAFIIIGSVRTGESFIVAGIFLMLAAFFVFWCFEFRKKYKNEYLKKGSEHNETLPQGSYRLIRKEKRVTNPKHPGGYIDVWFLIYNGKQYQMLTAPRFEADETPEINVTFWADDTCTVNYPFDKYDAFEVFILMCWAASPVFVWIASKNGGFAPKDPLHPESEAFSFIVVWGVIEAILLGRRMIFTQKRNVAHKIARVFAAILGILLLLSQIATFCQNIKYMF